LRTALAVFPSMPSRPPGWFNPGGNDQPALDCIFEQLAE
jgi:hypothetical protein